MSTEVTKEVPIKENMAIAAFMGKTVYPLRGTKEFKKWKGEACNYHWFNLKYHEDWNMLMPVIEKISKIKIEPHEQHVDYHYPRTFGMPDNEGRPMFRFNCGTLFTGETLIEAAHAAVYDFITWYNTTKQG